MADQAVSGNLLIVCFNKIKPRDQKNKGRRFGGLLVFGGVAQLVRACGSYPQCPEFESLHRHHTDRTLFHPRKGVLRFR